MIFDVDRPVHKGAVFFNNAWLATNIIEDDLHIVVTKNYADCLWKFYRKVYYAERKIKSNTKTLRHMTFSSYRLFILSEGH